MTDTNYLPVLGIDRKPLSKKEIKENLLYIYEALKEKGYNPITQITGYIMSEDPTYITAHKNARAIASKMDRFDILNAIVEEYLSEM